MTLMRDSRSGTMLSDEMDGSHPGARAGWRRLVARLGPVGGGGLLSIATLSIAALLALELPAQAWLPASGDRGALSLRGPSIKFDPLRQNLLQYLFGGPEGSQQGDRGPARAAAGRAAASAPGAGFRCAGFLCQATRISSLPYHDKRDTTAAPRQPGDPTSCAPAGGTTWYEYTPATSETLLANTAGSGFPLSLAVFQGDSPQDLVQLACVTNLQGNGEAGILARPGLAYFFQVTNLARGGLLQFDLRGIGSAEPVSVTSGGARADGTSFLGDVTPDGRYVVFISTAATLAGGPPCSAQADTCMQVFLRDRLLGTTSPISFVTPSTRSDGRYRIFSATSSADGRYVAFDTDAPLNANDTNNAWDVYLYDRVKGTLELESVSSSGKQGTPPAADASCAAPLNSPAPAVAPYWTTGCGLPGSYAPSISSDGRYLVFQSDELNLVTGYGTTVPYPVTNDPCDTDTCPYQVYIHDSVTGETSMVSSPTDQNYVAPSRALSADGRFVAFLDGDKGSAYVRDRRTGALTLISGYSSVPIISADGGHAAFLSGPGGVDSSTDNGTWQAYEWDAATRVVTRVSVSSDGQAQQPPGGGRQPVFPSAGPAVSISGDGRYTAIASAAPNLGGASGRNQIYVHDRVTGTTTLASAGSDGHPGDNDSFDPALSADGTEVAFATVATNIVPGGVCDPGSNASTGCWEIVIRALP